MFWMCLLLLTTSLSSCTPNCVQTAISSQYSRYLGSWLTPGIAITVISNLQSSVALNFRVDNHVLVISEMANVRQRILCLWFRASRVYFIVNNQQDEALSR